MTSTLAPPRQPAPQAPAFRDEAVLLPRKITLMHPWRGPAADPDVDPTGALSLQLATGRYVGGLFLTMVLLQRFALPFMPDAALLIPVVIGWVVWGLVRGIVEVNHTRLILWALAAGTAAVFLSLQNTLVSDSFISLSSYMLMFVVWFPAVIAVKDRRRSTFLYACKLIAYAAAFLAALCTLFMALQLMGYRYTEAMDPMTLIFPENFLLKDFVITYPIAYEHEFYRANGWIGLEPSLVSIMMSVGLLAGFFAKVRFSILLLLATGLLSSTAGSGIAILLVALIVIFAYPVRRNLEKYLPIAIPAVIAVLATPYGQSILLRAAESGSEQSSTDLRGILPYQKIWPDWVSDPLGMIFGYGPGSAQASIDSHHILGLLVPSPIKIFFEYGLIAGLFLFALLVFSYTGGHSRSIAVALAASFWFLQPATTTMVVVMNVYMAVTWWSPRVGVVLESDTSAYSAARRLYERLSDWRPSLSFTRTRSHDQVNAAADD